MPTTVRCPDTPGEIVGCGKTFSYDPSNDDGMIDCPHCGICFDPRDPNNQPQPKD